MKNLFSAFFTLAITLGSSNCFSQNSIFTEPCKEKVLAYSGGKISTHFDELVERCISISEYYEKQRKLQKSKDEGAKLRYEAELILRMDRIMKAKKLTDSDAVACGINIDPQAEQSTESSIRELESAILCLSLKK